MNKLDKICILIIIFLLFSFILYRNNNTDKIKYYFYNEKVNLPCINKLFQNIKLNKSFVKSKNINECKYILPSGKYSQSVNNLIYYMKNYKNKIFFLTPNNFIIGNKYQLWKTLKKYYGSSKASDITPYSYLMPDEYLKYKKDFYHKQKIIFKTDDQKQEGLYVTNNLVPYEMIKKEKFIIAQRFLTNSLLYKNHKITFRLYLIIVTYNKQLDAYIYDDGIVYYTKNNYNKNNNKEFYNIASFYDSKQLYKNGFPLTLKTFLKQINNGDKIMNNAIFKLKKLIASIRKPIFENINYNDNKCCELFGVDFFVNENYNCKILECNIGPGMEPFNKEDLIMRNNLFKNIINLLEYNNYDKLIKI